MKEPSKIEATTDTPRTDAHYAGRLAYYAGDKKFAETLECELAQAQERLALESQDRAADHAEAESDYTSLKSQLAQTKAAADDCASIAASCDCLTKTPDIQFHKIGCKYRLISERDTALRERDEARARADKNFMKGMELIIDRAALKAELADANEQVQISRESHGNTLAELAAVKAERDEIKQALWPDRLAYEPSIPIAVKALQFLAMSSAAERDQSRAEAEWLRAKLRTIAEYGEEDGGAFALSVAKTVRAALNTLQPLTGQWRTRCTVCGKEYEQGCGSSECCGALQEIIQ